MYFEKDKTYHIYNRSNSNIFYDERNYLFFLSKVKQCIAPISDILAWCLMPNHFHLLIVANEKSCQLINENHRPDVQLLSKNIGSVLSGYTRAINNQLKRKGKLFSHNTKAKCLNDIDKNEKLCFYLFFLYSSKSIKSRFMQPYK